GGTENGLGHDALPETGRDWLATVRGSFDTFSEKSIKNGGLQPSVASGALDGADVLPVRVKPPPRTRDRRHTDAAGADLAVRPRRDGSNQPGLPGILRLRSGVLAAAGHGAKTGQPGQQ